MAQPVLRTLSSPLILVLIVVFIAQLGATATIGDGTKSLYTGKAINESDGRGACVVDGTTYPSETAIPKDHPCHYCICYQAQVTCYWKACAAPPSGCQVMEFINVCNPSLYVCDIPEKTHNEPTFQWDQGPPRLRKKRIRRRRLHSRAVRDTRSRRNLVSDRKPFDEGFPISFETAWKTFQSSRGAVPGPVRSRRAIEKHSSRLNYPQNALLTKDTSCTILGVNYLLGEVIGLASDVCMECRCAAGVMFCSPKCCFLPSPFIPQPQQEGHALFIRGDVVAVPRPRHPLHYVRNQYTTGQFLR